VSKHTHTKYVQIGTHTMHVQSKKTSARTHICKRVRKDARLYKRTHAKRVDGS